MKPLIIMLLATHDEDLILDLAEALVVHVICDLYAIVRQLLLM